jgi:hypothetical protein
MDRLHPAEGEEMKFKLEADCVFFADDLDHAMYLLGEHFMQLHFKGADAGNLFDAGSNIVIRGIAEPEAEGEK